MRRFRTIFVLLAAAVLTAPPAAADETITRSFRFGAGDLLDLKSEGGDVQYRTGGSGEITIQVIAHKGKVSDHLALDFDQSGGRLTVRAERAGGGLVSRWFGGDAPPVEFRIEGPPAADLEIRTEGGDIDIDDVEGRIRLATSGGDIGFGTVGGELTAATSGGDIEGLRVAGPTKLATSGGDIRLETVDGDLQAATSGGDIQVDEVRGAFQAGTSGGDITAGDVDGDVRARTSGGDIRLGRAMGELDASTSGGNIHAEAAGGDARLSTSGGDLELRAAAGHVNARTSGGGVDVTLDPGNRSGVDLHTSDGHLIVRIPSGIGFEVDADAGDGRVRAEVAIRGSVGRERVKGTIAGGGNLLRLRNRDGDIEILESGR